MNNNGFLVKSDRFHLTDTTSYILHGWLVPGGELTAFLDKTSLKLQVECLSGIVSEKEHGLESEVSIHVPLDTRGFRRLAVYVKVNGERRLCFRIGIQDLEEKRGGIRCFLDELTVNRQDGFCRIQGWAVSTTPVSLTLVDGQKKKIPCEIQRFNRKDVVSMFGEVPVDPHCGFNIEVRPIPEKKAYLLLKAGEHRLVKAIPTSSAACRKEQLRKQVQKGVDYFYYNGLGQFFKKSVQKVFDTKSRPIIYSQWIQKHLPSKKELAQQRTNSFEWEPKISIVVPLYQTPEKYLEELVQSVREQTYSNWELCLSDGSGEDSPLTALLDRYHAQDRRIIPIHNHRQLHISENTNAAIEAATGEFIAFSDHDDLLTPHALYECVKALNEKREAEVLYSDEDKISIGDKLIQPNMKPDFNLDLLCTVNYICHLFVAKRSLIEKVGMLRPEFDGAQDYDFILRCVENTGEIYHIPKVLYHWRFFEGSTAENPESKLYAFEAGRRAVQAHYDRMGIPAQALDGEYLGLYRTKYLWKEKPLISIVIPNKDHTDDLKRCLESIEQRSTYKNYEFIIIENNSTDPVTFVYYKQLEDTRDNVKVVYWKKEFNYSAINNYGVQHAQGEYLLLLNNDTEIINENCLEELLGYCMREDVGAVGARLYYDDDTIQHAGVIVGFGGIAGHAFVQQKRGVTGYQHRIICAQDYSAVTAACMMVKRSVYQAVGGFSEELAVAFNDIDFCMKIRQLGKLIVYNPYAELYHYESKSRGMEDTPQKVARFNQEIDTFARKWPDILKDGDPYYSPNLTMDSQDFSLKRL